MRGSDILTITIFIVKYYPLSFLSLYPFRLVAGLLVCLSVSVPHVRAATILPSEVEPTPIEQWQTMSGDSLLVDTNENIAYLIHLSGDYTPFPVATGQRRVVRYIGRTYDARTPVRSWQVLSEQIKGDRITFGKLGRFLRLSRIGADGTEETPYGIHSHASIERMLARQDRYASMGCILVSDEALSRITETFERSGHTLNVRTVDGLGEELVTAPLLRAMVSESQEKDL